MRIFLFALIGLGEWFIASQRMSLIACGEGKKAALVVFLENLLGFFILTQFIKSLDNWWLASAYSVGAGLGTLINLHNY